TYLTPTCYGQPVLTASAFYQNKGIMTGDGQWTYQWYAEKVASGAATQVGALGIFSNTVTPTLYGPTLYIIPAGTISDNEVLEFASSMNSMDSACPVGSICNVAGHPLVVDQFGLGNSGFRINFSSAALAANQTVTFPSTAGVAAISPLITGAITNTHTICASGTAGVYIDCTPSGGGGTP